VKNPFVDPAWKLAAVYFGIVFVAEFSFGADEVGLASKREAFVGQSFETRDSLSPGDESRVDARQCLEGLCWTPETFQVDCEASKRAQCDALVRFPSPQPSGIDVVDRVAMEWYHARDPEGAWVKAPAVVVIHESGSGMDVGRSIAFALSRTGVHAFLLQLPGYGERRGDKDLKVDRFLSFCRQGIADARRAKDAVSVLPQVDAERVGLQGTSLGGFIGATSAALDGAYDCVFLMLAGGQLYEVLQNGKRDAANIRQRLEEAGLSGDPLREGLYTFEPNRLAHRLSPQSTWLFSGKHDTVVPLRYAESLASHIGLDHKHHVILPSNHYSGILHLPKLIFQMQEAMTGTRLQVLE
jgi:pimeloyl-ACP methyl ester carboxylesterase